MSPSLRPAFTVVELLVAIVVLTIGVLALAATAGLVGSQVGDGGHLTRAAHLARTTLDSLATTGCAALTSGSSTRAGTTVEWIVTGDSLAAQVSLNVGSSLRRGVRRDAYQLLVPCVRE